MPLNGSPTQDNNSSSITKIHELIINSQPENEEGKNDNVIYYIFMQYSVMPTPANFSTSTILVCYRNCSITPNG